MPFSTAYKNAMLDQIPATVWVQLHIGAPGSAGTSNIATETGRRSVGVAAAVNGARTNTSAGQWTGYPAAETLTHASAWTASSGGIFIGSATLAASRTPAIGDTIDLAVNDLDFLLTDS
jgi:hypothetical protein